MALRGVPVRLTEYSSGWRQRREPGDPIRHDPAGYLNAEHGGRIPVHPELPTADLVGMARPLGFR